MAKLTKTETKILENITAANSRKGLWCADWSPFDSIFYTWREKRFLRRLYEKGLISWGRHKTTGLNGYFIPGTEIASEVHDAKDLCATARDLLVLFFAGSKSVYTAPVVEFFEALAGFVPNDIDDSFLQLEERGFIVKLKFGWIATEHFKNAVIWSWNLMEACEVGEKYKKMKAS